MEKGFDLSEKIINPIEKFRKKGYGMIEVKDVKEFIRLLKKELCECHLHEKMKELDSHWICWPCIIINGLVGKEFL